MLLVEALMALYSLKRFRSDSMHIEPELPLVLYSALPFVGEAFFLVFF